MIAKLSSWKSKLLNLAGRITLAKSVLSSIPIYIMQCFPLPKVTTNSINQVIRKFIWDSSLQHKKIHLVNRETVIRPKIDGGLQIRDALIQNQAFASSFA